MKKNKMYLQLKMIYSGKCLHYGMNIANYMKDKARIILKEGLVKHDGLVKNPNLYFLTPITI